MSGVWGDDCVAFCSSDIFAKDRDKSHFEQDTEVYLGSSGNPRPLSWIQFEPRNGEK